MLQNKDETDIDDFYDRLFTVGDWVKGITVKYLTFTEKRIKVNGNILVGVKMCRTQYEFKRVLRKR